MYRGCIDRYSTTVDGMDIMIYEELHADELE